MTERDHGVPLLVAVTGVIFIRRFGHTHTHTPEDSTYHGMEGSWSPTLDYCYRCFFY